MQNSKERLLTTHVGSLVRPPEIIEAMRAKETGQPYDEKALAAHVRSSVAVVVRQQAEVGVDIPSDGEQGKSSFARYTHDRLTGLTPAQSQPGTRQQPVGKDRQDFAAFYAQYDPLAQSMWLPPSVARSHTPTGIARAVCTGPVSYQGQAAVQSDIANFQAALAGVNVEEAANPRHEHEWQVWQDVKLPDGKILIPGVITHSTNIVEHPELVAWRLKNYIQCVGRENVIAGTDCGFSQGWNSPRVHPQVQWAKLQALAEGARLASKA